MYETGLANPGVNGTLQSFSPFSALIASKPPAMEAAKTRLPAVVIVPPPPVEGARQRSVSVAGSHAKRKFPAGGAGGGGGGRGAALAAAATGPVPLPAASLKMIPQLYAPSSGLNSAACT